MAAKYPHGNKIYDLLVDLIMNMTQRQAEDLYSYLLPKYSKRAKVQRYNAEGLEDSDGKVRLLPSQYKSIRVKYGDTYVKMAFKELTNYIKYLEDHIEEDNRNKSKLQKYNSETHNMVLTRGWVYDKCKSFASQLRPNINVNPFCIDDINTAREYIKQIPIEMREEAMDVQALLLKFPELVDEPAE